MMHEGRANVARFDKRCSVVQQTAAESAAKSCRKCSKTYRKCSKTCRKCCKCAVFAAECAATAAHSAAKAAVCSALLQILQHASADIAANTEEASALSCKCNPNYLRVSSASYSYAADSSSLVVPAT